MSTDTEQLKRFLIDTRLITEARLSDILRHAENHRASLEDTLVSEGVLSADDMRRAKAHVSGIPFVDLTGRTIGLDVLLLVPEPLARTHNIVAYAATEKSIEVALLDLAELEKIDFVKVKSGVPIVPRLTDEESMRQAVRQYQHKLKMELGSRMSEEIAGFLKISQYADEKGAEHIVRIVDTLLAHAMLQDASDIHLEPFLKELVVRYRIDGNLYDAFSLPTDIAPALSGYLKKLAHISYDEKYVFHEGRVTFEHEGEKLSFCLSIMPTHYGEKIVLSGGRESGDASTLESLGFHGDGLEAFRHASTQADGMVLVAGTSGSGTTTTLYALIDMLNSPSISIATIEDPIELRLSRVHQTQVQSDKGLTMSVGLRAIMRQDPDIIVIGDMNDAETASLAVTAVRMGRRVVTAVKTFSAAEAIRILLDRGVDPLMVASTLKVVVAQRLVSTFSKDATKEAYKLSKAERAALGARVNLERVLAALKREKIVSETATWSDISFYRNASKSVPEMEHVERTAISEILVVSPAIRELIMRDSSAEEIEVQARKEGMLTMEEDRVFKAVQGILMIENVVDKK